MTPLNRLDPIPHLAAAAFTPGPEDNCSEPGAHRIAARITAYWAAKGFDVRPEVRQVGIGNTPRNERRMARYAVEMPPFGATGWPIGPRVALVSGPRGKHDA